MRFLLLITLLVLQGCIVTASQPLAPNVPEGTAHVLEGSWMSSDGKGCAEFIPDSDGRGLNVVFMEDDGSGGGFLLGLTRLGERDFMSGSGYEFGEPLNAGENIVVAYEMVFDGVLEIALIDIDAARRAVEAGEIEGQVIRGGWSDEVLLTAAPEALAAWLNRHGETLFGDDERMRFYRLTQQCEWWSRYEALRDADPAAVAPTSTP